jgi:hypothetical protein
MGSGEAGWYCAVGPAGIADEAIGRLETRQWGPPVDWRTGTARIHVRYEAGFYARGMELLQSVLLPIVVSHDWFRSFIENRKYFLKNRLFCIS